MDGRTNQPTRLACIAQIPFRLRSMEIETRYVPTAAHSLARSFIGSSSFRLSAVKKDVTPPEMGLLCWIKLERKEGGDNVI